MARRQRQMCIRDRYNSLPGAKEWRRELSENTRFSKNGDLLRFATDNIEEFIHSKSLILA